MRGDISTLNGSSLKLVNKFTYLGSSLSSTETDINTRLAKAWRLSIGYWPYGSQNWPIKWNAVFFQAAVFSILLYGCTSGTLTKRMGKKLDGNCTRMHREILNKSWRLNSTKQQLYGHLPPITKTIKVWRTKHARHCWRSKDELIRDILQWTPSHGRAKAGRPARIYIKQLWAETRYSFEDLPGVMDDRDGRQERVREIRAGGVTWWWWDIIQLRV